MLEVMKT